MLILVGNLEDIILCVLRMLCEVDLIYVEDMCVIMKLFFYFEIMGKKLVLFYVYNEYK